MCQVNKTPKVDQQDVNIDGEYSTNLVTTNHMESNRHEIEQVHEYKYLGHAIRIDKGNQIYEIHSHISLEWVTVYATCDNIWD